MALVNVNNKDVVLWVDSDPNVAKNATVIRQAGYRVVYCGETEDCINYIKQNKKTQRIVGIITSMMESGGRKTKGLKNGIQMIQYIKQNLISSMICIPEFGICSSSVNKNKCITQYGIKVVVKSNQSTNPRKEIQVKLIKKIKQNSNKAVIIWVDSNTNAQYYNKLFHKEGYKLKYFPETKDAINYVNKNKKNRKFSGIITSMMRSGGRKDKGLMDGLEMVDTLRNILILVNQQPIFAVVSSSCSKNECKQHGVNIIVKSSDVSNPWKVVKERLLTAIISDHNGIGNGNNDDNKQSDTDIIKSNFQSSCNNQFKIYFIEKIKSRSQEGIYEQILYNKCSEYNLKRNEIEEYAWHGSGYQGIQSILNKGFDRDFNSTSAYGRGTYFAKNAIYSTDNRYSPQHTDGYKYMLFCKIIVGKCVVGNSTMKKIPDDPSTNKPYDCMVNNKNTPSIFVIPKDYHAVPMYLVKFKKV